uniref:Uncharacterized protein n=1 Tax=Pithovirus LCPAC401 TaxID=2506595 RepID=A0A481ZA43_9VIRU|nr:MAG: hypothetical protein LCPAC401_01340 [Pithovirus LCPAC401]
MGNSPVSHETSLENLLEDTRNIKLPEKPSNDEFKDYKEKCNILNENLDSRLSGCTDPQCREDIERWLYSKYYPHDHSVALYEEQLRELSITKTRDHLKKYPILKDRIKECSYETIYRDEKFIKRYYECMKLSKKPAE